MPSKARASPQLSSSSPPPDRDQLAEIVASPATHLLVARGDDGAILGVEALVRWRQGPRRLLLPAEFIPVAERTDMIHPLTREVLGQAIAQAARWFHVGQPLRMSVNVSARNLVEDDLVDAIGTMLVAEGLPASLLEIELTETHLLGDLDLAVETLRALRDRGVRISIDDFGTGYSAMNHLRHLPIDSIKIDRSFIVAARVSDADAAVVDAVLAIGRSHGLEVVAEGIETAEDLEFVRGRGCDRGQGYYISYPLPIESAEALMFSTLAMQHA